ncbi:MAG: nickel pincer cofactor biosynthesis protein LarB [Deltaproteobacteria bacterium]|nr:nickel pincer cofactor biosynthesis protein LarB [Deltaproteobacteria bacterium]
MDANALKQLLGSVAAGRTSVDDAVLRLKRLPFEGLQYAHVDHHRSLRKGFPEVIFGQGKSAGQILGIARAMVQAGDAVLVTRLSERKARQIKAEFPDAVYHRRAGVLVYAPEPIRQYRDGLILVVAAGTSDIAVAEEAAVTAKAMGHPVKTLFDVGVSGLHRLLDHDSLLAEASVIIVVAGMEGALPSVVGGLVDKPVIAVPTSVGYGASLGGIAALLAMLNSCASNVTVVNIDNGFGAGYVAALINALVNRRRSAEVPPE